MIAKKFYGTIKLNKNERDTKNLADKAKVHKHEHTVSLYNWWPDSKAERAITDLWFQIKSEVLKKQNRITVKIKSF